MSLSLVSGLRHRAVSGKVAETGLGFKNSPIFIYYLVITEKVIYKYLSFNRDPLSPLHGKVFEGGKRAAGSDIPLRGLKTGVEYLLSRSTQLPHLDDAEAQYKVIRNFLDAVKKWQPKAWTSPKEYILLRGAGLWAVFFIGAQVIDQVLLRKQYKPAQMLAILKSGKDWDWGSKGDFKGYSGRSGAPSRLASW
jgi:hypothetical protein